jgi:hypothetical protein
MADKITTEKFEAPVPVLSELPRASVPGELRETLHGRKKGLSGQKSCRKSENQ